MLIQGAVNDAIDEAKQNIVSDLQTALIDFVNDKINSFTSFGEITVDLDHIELVVDPSSTLDIFTLLPFSSQLPLPAISLERVAYTYANTQLEVSTRGYGTQTIIPDVLELENIALSLVVELNDVNTLVVTFTGDFVVGGATIPVEVIYTHASSDVTVTADVPGITINFQSVATELVGLNLPSALAASISIPSFSINGMVTSSGERELVISATGGDIHVYIIYKKTSTTGKAIAVEIANIELASVLNDVTGLDISGIPFFGSVVLPTIGLTYSTQDINGLPGDIFANSPLLSNLGSSVEKDFTAYIKFDFSDDPIRLHYSGGIPTFSPAQPGSLDVNSLLSAIPGVDLSSIPLPPGVSGLLDLSVDAFALDIAAKSVEIAVSFPETLTFFDGFLTIENPVLFVIISTQGVKIDVDGDLSISGSGFDVKIALDEGSGDYILSASADELPISNVINQFQSEVLPSEISSLLGVLPFFSFSIDDPRISFPLSSSPLQIELSGTPVIGGYSTVTMASVIIRQGGKTLLVQGFEIGSFNIATFLTSITGFNFNSIALLNLELDAVILISPLSLPNVKLSGDKLSGFSVTKGLSVQASMQFPPDCSSDLLCAVAQFLLGEDAQLTLKGTIASATSFTLFAGVSNINLGSGVVMSEAGVEIKGGTTNSIGIVGAVDLSDPDITLAARVYLSTSGVVLEMTMSGCWENAFGASFLDICSLQASVSMIPGVTVTAFALGGEVHVGDDSCGTPLVATGFVGVDAVTPTNNYYYVNIEGSTTVGTILEAFCINIDVPAPLSESGFPQGFISSFSLLGIELPHVPLSIPQGYRLNGTLNILGLEASADVTVGLPDGIDFAVALPPINVAGLLRMYASSSDQSSGPFLTADIDLLPTPNVDVKASGYVSVLGIELEASMTITNTEFIFEITGKMLNLFNANLYIAASYGNIQEATFQVQGSFTNDLYDVLEEQIKNGLNSAGQAATSAVAAAQAELDNLKSALDSANSALQAGQNEVNNLQGAFDAAVAEVERLTNEVNSICSTSSCGSGELYLIDV